MSSPNLLPILALACLPGCVPPLSPVAAPSWPVHGTQYYSRQNAKYLGADSVDTVSYRLIDSMTYTAIANAHNGVTGRRAIRQLHDSSLAIVVDSPLIQQEIQAIRDSSLVHQVEYQLYIFIDRISGHISCIRDQPGTDTSSQISV